MDSGDEEDVIYAPNEEPAAAETVDRILPQFGEFEENREETDYDIPEVEEENGEETDYGIPEVQDDEDEQHAEGNVIYSPDENIFAEDTEVESFFPPYFSGDLFAEDDEEESSSSSSSEEEVDFDDYDPAEVEEYENKMRAFFDLLLEEQDNDYGEEDDESESEEEDEDDEEEEEDESESEEEEDESESVDEVEDKERSETKALLEEQGNETECLAKTELEQENEDEKLAETEPMLEEQKPEHLYAEEQVSSDTPTVPESNTGKEDARKDKENKPPWQAPQKLDAKNVEDDASTSPNPDAKQILKRKLEQELKPTKESTTKRNKTDLSNL